MMKNLNFGALNLDAILVTFPNGTGMRPEVPSAIAAMFPQDAELHPLNVEGKTKWAFGYVTQAATRANKDLVHFLTKDMRWAMNGNPIWNSTEVGDGIYLAECLMAKVLLFQSPDKLPTVLHMTCPKCGRTAWYESGEADGPPKFECAYCHKESSAEQMGVFVGAPNAVTSEPGKKLHELWARLGVTFQLDQAELEGILRNGTSVTTTEIIRKVVSEGRFYANGDSYIPESMAVIAGNSIGMQVPCECIDFDL